METGVIAAPDDQSAAAWGDQASAAAQNTAFEAAQNSAVEAVSGQGLLDLALPQLPADMPEIEAPEFILAKKISEESPALGTMPAGMPGLSGNQATASADGVLGGGNADISPLLGGAGGTISAAAAPAFDSAHSALNQAQTAMNGALGTGTGAAAAAAAPAVAVPQLPADPVGALMQGLAIPGIPGIDMLFKPILELLNSFGTGVIGALDPTQILSQSSKVIESALSIGKGGAATVDQLWQSQAGRNAQAQQQKANTEGQETSQRGIDISELTQRAAVVVQQGNAQLLGIASTFAAQATALVPVALTPPGQAVLIATATEHLGRAVGVANATRGDLAGKTAELTGVVNQLIAPGGLPAPQEVAQAAMQNIGEPILSKAQESAQSTATQAASLLDGTGNQGSPNSSTAPAASSSGSGSGGLSGALSGGGSGSSVKSGSPVSSGVGAGSGAPGSTISPVRAISGATGMPFGSSAGGTGTSGTGSGFMGGAPGAGAGAKGANEDEHSRNVDPYQSRTGNDDLTGPLGESTPDVIGATHPDELVNSDYEQDQF